MKARSTEAACTFEDGAVAEAMEIWQSLEAEPEVDDAMRATIAHNVALCLIQLGRGGEAIAPLEHCLTELGRLGLATEQAIPALALLRDAAVAGKASHALVREAHEQVTRVGRGVGVFGV